ncbi:hypothetical protein JD79_02824 [Geodermatophilus normandii]|uniref:DUF4126 domain-containing protein n=1 Tax=Geodermatophilus normandii TaxID=1137989 RepID=A0A317QKV9_9ACTN|nr:hypothetical protein [Geodermatophilus normandii]PWW23649.1 hypothetical protein JD79_02824 [Geodermatophilus normandii]
MTASLLLRAALLGTAAGGRSSLGLAAPALTAPARLPVRLAALAAVAGEVVADKLPGTPSRTVPPSAAFRLASGAGGGALLARRGHAGVVLPVLAGAAGAAAGTLGGARWRARAGERVPDWQAALAEDAVVLALATLACLPGRRGRGRGTMGA